MSFDVGVSRVEELHASVARCFFAGSSIPLELVVFLTHEAGEVFDVQPMALEVKQNDLMLTRSSIFGRA
jgi:hypothetical protein